MSWSSLFADDPGSAAIVAGVGAAYAIGLSRGRAGTGHRLVGGSRPVVFGAGLAVTVIAVASPLDGRAATSLAAHMVQHVLLISVAGPLLALGAPLPVLMWSLPERWRRPAQRWSRAASRTHDRRFVTVATTTIVIQAAALWLWHVPIAYEAALHFAPLHAVEHATFLLTSAAMWWVLATGRRSRRGAAAIATLAASTPGSLLGAAMLLAPNAWYPSYRSLGDQQLAGVVMWSFGGLAAAIAGAALFATWLASTGPEDRLSTLGTEVLA